MAKTQSKKIIVFFAVLAFCCGFASQAAAADMPDPGLAKCKGHGTVGFKGDGSLTISGNGVLLVNEDAEVAFFHEATATDIEFPECYPVEDGRCAFINVSGKAFIAGENLDIFFAGANIGLTASGNATLTVKGYGIYKIGLLIGPWSSDGTTFFLKD